MVQDSSALCPTLHLYQPPFWAAAAEGAGEAGMSSHHDFMALVAELYLAATPTPRTPLIAAMLTIAGEA